jgi:hypothetical protein
MPSAAARRSHRRVSGPSYRYSGEGQQDGEPAARRAAPGGDEHVIGHHGKSEGRRQPDREPNIRRPSR